MPSDLKSLAGENKMMLYRLVLETPGTARYLQRTWRVDMRRRGNPGLTSAVRRRDGSPSVVVSDPDGSVMDRLTRLAAKSGLDYKIKPFTVSV